MTFFYILAIFSKMRQNISTLPVISFFMKFCIAKTILVKFHLDVVLKDLQGPGLDQNFFFTKLVDIYHMEEKKKICFQNWKILDFNLTFTDRRTDGRTDKQML